MKRCVGCGAKIIDDTCHCGQAGRMREPFDGDAEDAVAAWEAANPHEVGVLEFMRGES